jgi:hypothetical protein
MNNIFGDSLPVILMMLWSIAVVSGGFPSLPISPPPIAIIVLIGLLKFLQAHPTPQAME